MKKISLSIVVAMIFLFSCSTPEDEKQLKEQFDKFEAFAKTPEEKETIHERYKEALEQLRTDRKEKEEKAKIFPNKENDVTNKLFQFCDELWADKNFRYSHLYSDRM